MKESLKKWHVVTSCSMLTPCASCGRDSADPSSPGQKAGKSLDETN